MYLDEQYEDVESFKIRRVHWAAKKLVEENKELMTWRLLKLAGLNEHKISTKVKVEIEHCVTSNSLEDLIDDIYS